MDKFPIYLFNQYNNATFDSFTEVKMNFKMYSNVRDYNYFIGNLFKEQNNIRLFQNLLSLFPYIFFNTSNLFTEKFLLDSLKANKIILDSDKLLRLFNLKIDIIKIAESFEKINEVNKFGFVYKNFATQLFIILYKYSFYQISDSMKINEYGNNLTSYLLDYNKFIKELDKTNYDKMKKLLREYTKNFCLSISEDSEIVDRTLTELEIFGNKSYLSKLLYSVIDNNIQFSSEFSSTIRYRLIRPLFQEIVCNICYHECYELDTNDNELVDKYRYFLDAYNIFLKE